MRQRSALRRVIGILTYHEKAARHEIAHNQPALHACSPVVTTSYDVYNTIHLT